MTFSFRPFGVLSIGGRYDYIIDADAKEIRIVASEDGRYRLSRKRSGVRWLSLVDLRRPEIVAMISEMKMLRVRFTDKEILITEAEAETSRATVLCFPRDVLRGLRAAVGIGAADAAKGLLDSAQLTFDEFLDGPTPFAPDGVVGDFADVYSVVSLFSGAGVLDWPFANDPHFSLQYAIELDEAACRTYRHNIGLHLVQGDVHRAFTGDGYPLDQTIRHADAVIGGPPCKPFSSANRHTRLADHPDSELVVQYMRVVDVLRPKVFAIENVPEFLTACDGAYFVSVAEAARSLGYELTANIIQDSKVGGYTTRRRAVIIGSRLGRAVLPTVEVTEEKTAGDALMQVNKEWTNFGDVTLPRPETLKRMQFVPQGGNYLDIPAEYRTESKNRHSCTYRRLSWNEPSPTIVNWRKPPLIHPLEDRTLSVAEAKALQGLPGSYRIFGTLGQMQQQVGNAVPVAMGRYVKQILLSVLQADSRAVVPAK